MVAMQGEPSTTMLTNLSDIMQEIKYKTIVPYLPDTNGMDINPIPAVVKYICIGFFVLRAKAESTSFSFSASPIAQVI